MSESAGNSLKESIQQLLELADSALEDGLTAQDRLDRLDLYCEQFSRWQTKAEHKDTLTSDCPIDRGVLQELQTKHSLVLAAATGLAAGVKGDLHALRKRARGLMRYVDQLPRQVSAWIQRKG